MSALSIQVPFPVFQGRDGQPLKNGYVWIGEPNLNPQTNPVVAYYDKALTIIAPQPLRTLNGYVSRAGTPAQIYVDGVNFSILVQDSKGSMVYNFPDGSGIGAQASGVAFTGFKGQVGFVQDLADNNGSDWIGFQPSGTGAVARSAQEKMLDLVSVKDFGAVGDGVTDDTAAFQAAINSGARSIYVPSLNQGLSYQLTSTLQVTTPVCLIGDGVEIFRYSQGIRGAGSWIHLNHTGIGINFSDTNGTAARTGGGLENIGTWRTQPTPTAGWTPTAYDWDISVSNYDVVLQNVILFNPTKGVYHDKGNAGRLTIDGLYGQPLTQGIEVNETYDVCRLSNIHFWPYWSDHADVRAWTLTHRRDISLKRCDNPFLSNIFTIFGQYPLVLTPGPAGVPSKVHLSNVDLDGFGGCGILFEAGANSVTLQGANVTMQGQTGYPTTGIQVNSNNCIVAFANLSINNIWRHAVELLGVNNIFTLNGLESRDWNLSNTSLAAIYANTGCFVRIGTRPYLNDTYTTAFYSGLGKFEVPLVGAYASTTTNASGNVTINHDARCVPTGVIIQCYGGAAGMTAQITATSNATFTVNFMDATGAALASTAVAFYWEVKLQ